MLRPPVFRSLIAFLAVLALILPAAQASDPVLSEVGSHKERVSTVLVRFEIAVRGIVMSQGGAFSREVLEQVYPFLPQYLEQRGAELALLEAARARGIVVDDEAVDAVIEQARAQFPDEATFQQVLEGAGFADVEALKAIVREDETVQALLAAIEDDVVFSELELRVAYEALRPQLMQPEQVCARHILVDSETGAAALARAARAGADFAAMAGTASTDRGSAARGGDLGCFPRGAMVPEFEDAAFAAEIGVATDPVRSQFGYHVILVERVVAATTLSLDEVREPLEQQVRSERAQAIVEAIIQASSVRTYPDRLPSFEEAFGHHFQDAE